MMYYFSQEHHKRGSLKQILKRNVRKTYSVLENLKKNQDSVNRVSNFGIILQKEL